MNFDEKRFLSQVIGNINFHVFGKKTDTYDILHLANFLSSIDSASYFLEKMPNAKNYGTSLELLTRGMAIKQKQGLILEFGVASGQTINHLASLSEQRIFGFDGFDGLPKDWRIGFEKGAFAQSPPIVRQNVELVVGLFEDSLPAVLPSLPKEMISLMHVDCDLYSSTKTIFQHVGDRIVPGTVIIFDEYFNYPGWRQHEYKAFQEFINEKKLSYRYDSFVSMHQQVCVVIE
jgi:hypothetical protein